MNKNLYAGAPRMVIRKSRKKAAVVTVAGFVLGIAGALLLHYAADALTGWCFVAAAVLTLVYGVGSSFDRKPYIILTETGIADLSVIREEIEWEAVEYVDDFFFRGQDFVRLLLDRDYKPRMIRPSWFWRFDRIYGLEGVKAVYIRTSGLEIGSMRLAALIRRMIKADAQQRREVLEGRSV